MSSLNNTLADIARGFGLVEPHRIKFPHCLPGANNWDNITAADYGNCFDYIILRRGGNTVIDPTSEAALQWLYRHLPEDCPRYGGQGFVIESEFVHDVLESMAVNGLLSEDDYVYAMNAEDRDRHQGEDQ